MITTWYLQSHRTWDRSRQSCIGSPSSPWGPSRRASLCRLTIRGTPDRSKLFGSHGQRPWLHDVVSARRPVPDRFDVGMGHSVVSEERRSRYRNLVRAGGIALIGGPDHKPSLRNDLLPAMRRPWDTTVESRPRVPPGVHRERGDDPEPTTGHAAGAPTTGAPDPGAVPRDEWPSIAVRSPRDG